MTWATKVFTASITRPASSFIWLEWNNRTYKRKCKFSLLTPSLRQQLRLVLNLVILACNSVTLTAMNWFLINDFSLCSIELRSMVFSARFLTGCFLNWIICNLPISKLKSSGLKWISTGALQSGSRLSLASSTLSPSTTLSHNLASVLKTNPEISDSWTVESGGSLTSQSTKGCFSEEACSCWEGREQPWLKSSGPWPGDKFVELGDDQLSWPPSPQRSPEEDPKPSSGSFEDAALCVCGLNEIDWLPVVCPHVLRFPERLLSEDVMFTFDDTSPWVTAPLTCSLDAVLSVWFGLATAVIRIQATVTLIIFPLSCHFTI